MGKRYPDFCWWMGLFLCLTFGCYAPKEDSRPNILIIVADDLGWHDVSYHGSEIRTPNIDRLVSQGAELDRFYTAPICTPTRAGILSGLYPGRFGLREGVIAPRVIGGLPPAVTTLAEMLAEAGYQQRAAFGKWHLGHSSPELHPLQQGFTSFYGHYNGALDYFTHERAGQLDWHDGYQANHDQGYTTELVTRKVIDLIHSESREQRPFFAYVAFNAPHSPMQATAEDLEDYNYDPEQPSEEFPVGGSQRNEYNNPGYGRQGRGHTLRQTYSAMVSALDRGIGQILQALDSTGLAPNTLVWLLSDNGGAPHFGGDNFPLRGAKHTEWEGGVRTVAAVRWPGRIPPGNKIREPIAYIDLMPTIHAVINPTATIPTDGTNVLPLFRGEEIRDRYIYLGREALVGQKWKLNQGSLFAIESDPGEKEDVSGNYPAVMEMLQEKLREFQALRSDQKPGLRPPDWQPPENWEHGRPGEEVTR